MPHLLTMQAAAAELERDMLVERTQAEPARAKSEGKALGCLSKTSAVQREEITVTGCQIIVEGYDEPVLKG